MDHLALCPICGRDKTYKTKQAYLKSKDRPCLSCANSLKAGGVGSRYCGPLVKCASCQIDKDPKEFNARKNGNYSSYCKDCQKDRNAAGFSSKYRYAKYGLTKETFEALRANQNNNCGICSNAMSIPCVDHDHATGKVRGLLCRECNSALGFLKDNLNSIKNMITYLEGK